MVRFERQAVSTTGGQRKPQPQPTQPRPPAWYGGTCRAGNNLILDQASPSPHSIRFLAAQRSLLVSSLLCLSAQCYIDGAALVTRRPLQGSCGVLSMAGATVAGGRAGPRCVVHVDLGMLSTRRLHWAPTGGLVGRPVYALGVPGVIVPTRYSHEVTIGKGQLPVARRPHTRRSTSGIKPPRRGQSLWDAPFIFAGVAVRPAGLGIVHQRREASRPRHNRSQL